MFAVQISSNRRFRSKNYFIFKVRVKQKDNDRNFNAIVNSKTFLVEGDSYLIATKCYKDSEFIWIKNKKQICKLPNTSL